MPPSASSNAASERCRPSASIWASFALAFGLLISLTGFAPSDGKPFIRAYDERRREILSLLQPALYRDMGAKPVAYDLVAEAALKSCPASGRVDATLKAINPPTDMFARPPLTRFLFQYGRCLNDEQRRRMIVAIAYPDQLFGHGTLNHAIMSASSYYLLAERLPDLKWSDLQGHRYNSAEVAARYKALLMRRFQKFMASGHAEQLSPTYAMIDLFPLLNLIDFAQDHDVRDAAEAGTIAQIALMRADSLNGAMLSPVTRENPPGQTSDNPASIGRDVLWLYYGGFEPPTNRPPEPDYVSMLAASPWRPPEPLLALRPAKFRPYDIHIRTPSFSIWDGPTQSEEIGQAHIEPEFAIGSGDILVDPGGYDDHTSAFRIVIAGLRPVGVVDCYQPYWHGDAGEDAWGTDLSSPFQQSWQDGRRGLLLYDIPERDPYRYPIFNHFFAERAKTADHLHQLATCRLPLGADEIKQDAFGLVARYGRVFLSLHTLGGLPAEIVTSPKAGPLKDFMTLKARGGKITLYYSVKVGHPGENLQEFADEVARDGVGYDSRTGVATVSRAGRHENIGFVSERQGQNGWLTRAGTTSTSEIVATSPLLTWRSGELWLKSPAGDLRLGVCGLHTCSRTKE